MSYKTNRLLLSQKDVVNEGVINYFAGECKPAIRSEIEKLLLSVTSCTGGHVFPLMRLSELLVRKITQDGFTADQAISHLNSLQFRSTQSFRDLSQRIVPSLQGIDIRPIFRPRKFEMSPEVLELQRRGFCDGNFKVVSTLLLDQHW